MFPKTKVVGYKGTQTLLEVIMNDCYTPILGFPSSVINKDPY